MTDMRKALEAEREMEREFVAEALKSEPQPKGWPAALVMFHLSMWRERLRNALTDFRDGRPYPPPPTRGIRRTRGETRRDRRTHALADTARPTSIGWAGGDRLGRPAQQ